MGVPGGLPGDVAWALLHADLMIAGFVVQLPLAVAYWIAPRTIGRRRRGRAGEDRFSAQSRGLVAIAASALAAVNASVLALLVGRLLDDPRWLIAGRLLLLFGALLFAAHLWRRIRPSERERHESRAALRR
jgi:hypothetical protein